MRLATTADEAAARQREAKQRAKARGDAAKAAAMAAGTANLLLLQGLAIAALVKYLRH